MLQGAQGGEMPSGADSVEVYYSGWTPDGHMFDSTVLHGDPRDPTHGGPAVMPLAHVIDGWKEGLPLMREGEKRRFWVPSGECSNGSAWGCDCCRPDGRPLPRTALAYGDEPRSSRSPAGPLVFDIELVSVCHGRLVHTHTGTNACVAPPPPPPPPVLVGGSSDPIAALVALKGSSVGNEEMDLTTWLPRSQVNLATTCPCCVGWREMHAGWMGVQCTRQGGQVSLLYLPHVPLGGDLSAISMVATMHSLYLLDTGLTGDLASLSQMTRLNDLDLTETNVHGDLSALSDLPLQNIWLSKTAVTGDIRSLRSMVAMSWLDLSHTG